MYRLEKGRNIFIITDMTFAMILRAGSLSWIVFFVFLSFFVSFLSFFASFFCSNFFACFSLRPLAIAYDIYRTFCTISIRVYVYLSVCMRERERGAVCSIYTSVFASCMLFPAPFWYLFLQNDTHTHTHVHSTSTLIYLSDRLEIILEKKIGGKRLREIRDSSKQGGECCCVHTMAIFALSALLEAINMDWSHLITSQFLII